MMKPRSTNSFLLIGIAILCLTLLSARGVEAHGWKKRAGCSSVASCGGRSRCDPFFPRRYDYHRRHVARQDAMDIVSDMLSKTLNKINGIGNSLLLQQQGRRASLDLPYSVEDYGDAGMELSMEVPGMKQSDILVELEQESKILVISGRRSKRERGFASQSEFSHSLKLDDDIDVDAIEVMLQSEVLTIALPRKQKKAAERKNIPITLVDDKDETDEDEEKADEEEQDLETRKQSWKDDFVIFEDDQDVWD